MLTKLKLIAAACGLTLFGAGPANAAYTITFAQVGNDVVAVGTGTLNITGLAFVQNDSSEAQIWPGRAWALIGAGNADAYSTNLSFTGSLGSGGQRLANSNTGGKTGVLGTSGLIFVPTRYVSGTLTSATSTFTNSTFQSLGLNPGSLIATFNSGMNTDQLIVIVPASLAAVPEPATWAMMLMGFGGVGFAMRRRIKFRQNLRAA